MEACLIAGRNMVDGMLEVRECVKEFGLKNYDKDTHDGLLRHLMVRESFATGEMILALFATKTPDGELAGIEIVETSIESAKRNAFDNDLHNTTFLAREARRGLDEIHDHLGFADILLIDPPRSGVGGKVMRRIGCSKPKRIVYVSCNPDTFATDVTELHHSGLHASNPATCRPVPAYRAR